MYLVINGEYLDERLVRTEVQTIKRHFSEDALQELSFPCEIEIRERARENVINWVLLCQAADQHADSPVAANAPRTEGESAGDRRRLRHPTSSGLLDFERNSRLQRLLAHLTKNVPSPTRKEVSAFYELNRALFYSPEAVRVSHIIKNVDDNTPEEAAWENIQAAKNELQKGRRFAEVADRWSDCPGAGGDLGWFVRGEMVEEFDAVVFQLKKGETSQIFRSPFGFHIAKLYERQPEGFRALLEVAGDIKQRLLQQKKDALIDSFLAVLRARADIRKVSEIALAQAGIGYE